MPFPDILYYKELVVGKSFTREPSGRVDLNRLLQQNPDFWEKPSYLQNEKKKKQLIFSDWCFFGFSSDKQEQSIQKIQLLLDDNFPVWFPTQHGLVFLKTAASLLDKLELWNPSVSAALQWAAQQGIARDQLAVLDCWVMCQCFPELLFIEERPERPAAVSQQFYSHAQLDGVLLKTSDLGKLAQKYPSYYAQIQAALIENSPCLLNVVIDVKDDDYGLFNFLSQLPIKRLLLSRKLSNKSCQNLQNTFFSYDNIGELYVESPHFTIQDPFSSKLKGLNYSGHSTESLKSLLAYASELEILDLRRCKMDISSLLIAPNLKFHELKSLSLLFTIFDTNALRARLSFCPNLQILDLNHTEQDLGCLFTEALELPALTTLSLYRTTFDVERLGPWLSFCKDLQILHLGGCKMDLSGLFTENLQLHKLKELNLSRTTFNVERLKSWLPYSCPNLQILQLGECTMDLSSLFTPNLNLPELIELDLFDANFDVNDLQGCLSFCPNLQTLNFTCSTQDLSGLFTENLQLHKLKKLNLSGTTFNVERLKSWLPSSCPNLQTLDLTEAVQNLSSLFITPALKLPKLIKLSLSCTIFDVNALEAWLSFYPNLQLLDLSGCEMDLSSLFSSKLKLPALTNLSLYGTTFNVNALETCLSSCKNLEELSVSNIKDREYLVSRGFPIPEWALETTTTPRLSTTVSLDANTQFREETQLSAQAYFTPETDDFDVRCYRLRMYDQIVHEKGHLQRKLMVALPTLLEDQPSRVDVLQPCVTESQTQDATCYTGQIVATLDTTNWFPLPSLRSYEKLTKYHASEPLDFGYAKNTNQYAVRLKSSANATTPTKVQIQYVLTFPKQTPSSLADICPTPKQLQRAQRLRFCADGTLKDNFAYRALKQLPQAQCIAVLVKSLCQFGVDTSDCSAQTIMENFCALNDLIKKRVGACRHRAYLFLALAKALDITARVIANDCHAFVEVKYGDKWIQQDLGGYPAQLQIKPLQEVTVGSVPVKIKTTSFTEAIVQLRTQLADYDQQEQQVMLSFSSSTDIERFYHHLSKRKNVDDTARVLYLPSFRELHFSAVQVTETAPFYKKIDSPFMRDLKQLKVGDILLINLLDRYQRTDVGYNTLFDAARRLQDTPIAPGVLIIAAVTASQSSQLSEDVLSRFSIRQVWEHAFPQEPIALQPDNIVATEPVVIDLYERSDWQRELTGQLQYSGHTESPFTFKPGAFQQAIADNKHLEIRHAPIDSDVACKRFFADLQKNRCIESNGEKTSLPPSLTWQLTHPAYEFTAVTVEPIQEHVTWDTVLSPYTVDELFSRYYYCNTNRRFTKTTGLLENNYYGKTLRLYVTHTLSDGVWAQLCQQAVHHHCSLHVVLGDNVQLPAGLPTKTISTGATREQSIGGFSARCCISNDAAWTVSRLKTESDLLVIPIDQHTTYTDLVTPLTMQPNPAALLPDCQIQKGVLLTSLEAGRSVVLRGSFSLALASQLSSIFSDTPVLRGNGEEYPLQCGQVTLVTEQQDYFAYLKKDNRYEQQQVGIIKYLDQLEREGVSETILLKLKENLDNPSKEALCFSQLNTLVRVLQTQSHKNPAKSLTFFSDDAAYFQTLGNNLKGEGIRKKTRDCLPLQPEQEERQRLEKIKTQLEAETYPYLFLMGPSGIGKSTLVLEKLGSYYERQQHDERQQPTLRLSVGMEQVVRWASDTTEKTTHVLFIDEANRYPKGSFDGFEGLFDHPPSLFIEGKLYPLTPHHKIIFCGNATDSQGCHSHQFFKRHGGGFAVKPWSDSFLLTTVIHPLLQQADQAYLLGLSENEKEELAQFFLKNYRSSSLLTPRNLQMMILRFAMLAQKDEYKLCTVFEKASVAAYDEMQPHLSKAECTLWKKTALQAGINYHMLRPRYREEDLLPLGSHLVPSRRRRASQRIQDQLEIRTMQKKENIAPSLAKAGLHGILLEGNSGIGKSDLVRAQLHTLDYQENHPNPDKCYRYLTLTDPAKSEQILTHAFHQGEIVVIDELNTLCDEKLLLSLMSGADLEGQPAARAGFFVCATQNSHLFHNRRLLSAALENRFYKSKIKDYTPAELKCILIAKGVTCDTADKMLDEYQAKRERTSTPALQETPRDLFRQAAKLK
jgi:hypothetical protein